MLRVRARVRVRVRAGVRVSVSVRVRVKARVRVDLGTSQTPDGEREGLKRVSGVKHDSRVASPGMCLFAYHSIL